MTQSLYLVAVVVLLLALVPVGVRWIMARLGGGSLGAVSAGRILSAVAVGPQQRVVTVEVGVAGSRVCLVLGVTPQSVTCLHAFPPSAPASAALHPETGTASFGGKGA